MKMNYVVTAVDKGRFYIVQVENGSLVKRQTHYHNIPRGLVFSQYEDALRIANYVSKRHKKATKVEPLDAVMHRLEKENARAKLGQ